MIVNNAALNYLSAGVVEISPSAVAPVCRVGDQLELTSCDMHYYRNISKMGDHCSS